jgi:tetratricopeptide (TPR) repeat protein
MTYPASSEEPREGEAFAARHPPGRLMRLLARIAPAACALGALVGLLSLGATTAAAQRRRTLPAEQPATPTNSRDNEARMLFEAGRVAYTAGRFDDALGYFKRAHEISGRAVLLYNVGSAADKLRQDAIALDAFRRYLEAVPNAENREEVEARVRVLEGVAAAAQARTTPTTVVTTPTTVAPPPTTVVTTPTTVAPPPTTVAAPPTTVVTTPTPTATSATDGGGPASAPSTVPTPAAAAAAAAQSTGGSATLDATLGGGETGVPVRDAGSGSIFSKWWFWTIVGVAVAGATVGVVAATAGGDTLGPFQPGDDGSVYMTLVSP